MRGKLGTLAATLVATFAVVPLAHGEEPQTREGYVAQVEPICKVSTEASKRILAGAGERIKKRKLKPAGRQFIRVSKSFGQGIQKIVAVPRPPADEARLQKWFGFLRTVKTHLFDLGKTLTEDERLHATHEQIKLERSANAANNVSFVFHFHYCRLNRSNFR